MQYVNIASYVIKNRFYHGYSYFNAGFNTIGWALAPLIKADLAATVLVDDILKFPNAACSQQTIVFLDVLKQKGISYRKVGFNQEGLGGHFASEIWYNNQWHYYDVNKEPNAQLLELMNRPSINKILSVPGLIDSIYAGRMNVAPAIFFRNPIFGPKKETLAPTASNYQLVTRALSYSLPIWVFLFFWQLGWLNEKTRRSGPV